MHGTGLRHAIMDAAALAACLCAVGLTGSVILDRRSTTPAAPLLVRDTASVKVGNWVQLISDGHRIGSDSARVTILEFGDFECPACGALERVLHGLRAKYSGRLALVFRNWPLSYHRFAYPAARAAECAGFQGRFVEYHDLLYQKQDSLGLVTFEEMARRANVPDLAVFDACLNRSGPVVSVEQDIAAALSVGGHFTPTLIINGWRLGTVPDSVRLEAIIRSELASGIPGARVMTR